MIYSPPKLSKCQNKRTKQLTNVSNNKENVVSLGQELNKDLILIIDDDIELTNLMSQYLTSNGFEVTCHHSGVDAVDVIAKLNPQLLVLDLMLPGKDGLSICKEVRDSFNGPIIMLTALNDDIDEVTGLEMGADDYLSKPIKPRVLLAHIRAQQRRHEKYTVMQSGAPEQVKTHDIIIDNSKRLVQKNGEAIELTSAEFDLLWILAMNVGQAVSRDDLHKQIFRLEYDGTDRSIDLRISRIRRKLGDNPKNPTIIKTVRNQGYQLSG